MSHRVLLDIPEEWAHRAQAVAQQTHHGLEDVLVEWLGQAAVDVPPNQLPDDQVLALCGLELSAAEQRSMNELLFFAAVEGRPVDAITGMRRGPVIDKARALAVAADRGLRLPGH
jgi:hypothetical protein